MKETELSSGVKKNAPIAVSPLASMQPLAVQVITGLKLKIKMKESGIGSPLP